jgi:hypothetical protein
VAFALQLRKIMEVPQGNRKELGLSALKAIRLADLAIAGEGLVWFAGLATIGFRVKRRG